MCEVWSCVTRRKATRPLWPPLLMLGRLTTSWEIMLGKKELRQVRPGAGLLNTQHAHSHPTHSAGVAAGFTFCLRLSDPLPTIGSHDCSELEGGWRGCNVLCSPLHAGRCIFHLTLREPAPLDCELHACLSVFPSPFRWERMAEGAGVACLSSGRSVSL